MAKILKTRTKRFKELRNFTKIPILLISQSSQKMCQWMAEQYQKYQQTKQSLSLKMKRGKAQRKDGIVMDVFENAGEDSHSKLIDLSFQYIHQERLGESWCNAIVMLLHQKLRGQTRTNQLLPTNSLSNIYSTPQVIQINRRFRRVKHENIKYLE